ncbi:hypothetical protein SARC_05821 [Sphaeroforma arctica JP610]|uniref:Uncharacterized protein n=1 Tax=Sphaeroforma arctica JP610 TaxID=667725 RepID=A0A0L0FYG3_9EUKA|nr:hypothetical protein SARC_05821 [Sphaeroforma arctica JP610]KNC81875.1 hypothetical protein SARC_05821 [Sphaeroforma arctica JP610]|eukprot:XP_014155777.1 hypothetical protein SARC_05821 [Sphaeroforma arctica JP610]
MSYNPVSDLKATNLVPGVFVPVQTYVTPDFEVVDERLLGYTEEIKPHQKEFTDDFTRSMTWERSSAFFVDLHRKVFAPAHSESKDETRNKYTKYGGVGYILGNSLSGAYVLGNDEKENITFYPALTPEGVRIDMLFSTGMLNKTHMLSTAPYDHATALAIWERKGPYSKLSPLLAEPTSVGYGTPNPYLPWKIPPCKGFPDTPPLPPAELESNR